MEFQKFASDRCINSLYRIHISGKTKEARRSFAWLYGKQQSIEELIVTDVKLATKLLVKENSKYVIMKPLKIVEIERNLPTMIKHDCF